MNYYFIHYAVSHTCVHLYSRLLHVFSAITKKGHACLPTENFFFMFEQSIPAFRISLFRCSTTCKIHSELFIFAVFSVFRNQCYLEMTIINQHHNRQFLVSDAEKLMITVNLLTDSMPFYEDIKRDFKVLLPIYIPSNKCLS